MLDPATHEAHDTPLAHRIVSDLIGDYIVVAADTALAANGYLGAEAEGWRKAIEHMRYLALSGWDYRLTPKILDALRRAGQLAPADHQSTEEPDHD